MMYKYHIYHKSWDEPIILKDITVALDVIEGVQTVKNVFITSRGVNHK